MPASTRLLALADAHRRLAVTCHRRQCSNLRAGGPAQAGASLGGPSGVLVGGRSSRPRTDAGCAPPRRWPWQGPLHPRCGAVSSEQGAHRRLYLLLEDLIDLFLQLLLHRFQGLLYLLVQLFVYRLERLIDLLVQLLSDGL